MGRCVPSEPRGHLVLLRFFRRFSCGTISGAALQPDGFASAGDLPCCVSHSLLHHAHLAALPASDRSAPDNLRRLCDFATVAQASACGLWTLQGLKATGLKPAPQLKILQLLLP